MGQSMTCCGGDKDDPNDFKTDFGMNKDMNHPDKIKVIVRIQALYRGFKARMRVAEIKATRGPSIMGKFAVSPDGKANYDNQEVMVRPPPFIC